MVDNSEVHPAVKLLIERMKSHPEEFKEYFSIGPETLRNADEDADRWGYALDVIQEFGSDADKAALAGPMRDLKLEETYKWMLDELLNGEARRTKEKADREEQERKYMQAMSLAGVRPSIGAFAAAQAQAQSLGASAAQLQNYAAVKPTPQDRFEQHATDDTLITKLRKGLGI